MSIDNRGYLNDPFLSFHLNDANAGFYQDHVHAFHKIILVLSGQVIYRIEGITYVLEAHDILLVPAEALHMVEVKQGQYERQILWIRRDIFAAEDPRQALLSCFQEAAFTRRFLLRGNPSVQSDLEKKFRQIDAEQGSPRPFSDTSATAWLCLLLAAINRMSSETMHIPEMHLDPVINVVLDYIRTHLSEDLGVEQLAHISHMSRFALMHRFKQMTGFTLHHFVQRKRLLAAAEEMRAGKTAQAAASSSGFGEYSSFSRAWKAFYGNSPRAFMKAIDR